ncbi:Maf family nucleotide pyrophosphatase [Fulvivirgaceae bacterium LMO-SS25]
MIQNLPFRLILASKSPRRKQLLEEAGFEFEIRTQNVKEDFPSEMQASLVPIYLAEKKALGVSILSENELIIASDTIVEAGGEILGKPESPSQAAEMLMKLSGTTHKVITGVCLRSKSFIHSFSEETNVTFKKLSIEEIQYYIINFMPLDKAGAYGIQEWIGLIGVSGIQGCYFNVVGFPVARFYKELNSLIRNL